MNGASASSMHSPPPSPHDLMLKESIDHFLCELHKSRPEFSGLSSIFARLVQTIPDPPLEIVWFHSAVAFRSCNSADDDPLTGISVAKDLFRLLVSCSTSFGSIKSVATLAPVVFKVFELVGGGEFLWVRAEVECLVEGIVSYVSMCCCRDLGARDGPSSECLRQCFGDLVHVWTVDRSGENWDFGEDLRLFFPLVSDVVRRGFGVGCGVGYLAGVVMSEVFLLALCLKFGSETSREELQKELLNWAAHAITGFRNWYFFDVILRMLLDPVLPVTSLLSSEDEVLVRKVLYDAVMMVEHSFLDPKRGIQLPATNHLTNLAVSWLFVADDAIQFVRKHGDQTKVISYINAFTESHLCSQLIEWVTNQRGMEHTGFKPNVSSPSGLIRWLLIVEGQGLRLFDHISNFRDKVVIYKSMVNHELSVLEANGNALNGDIFFHTDNEDGGENDFHADQVMADSIDAPFLAGACTMSLTVAEVRRKRKEGGEVEGETQAKFLKYQFDKISVAKKSASSGDDDGLSSGSEVHNLVSDEDREYMEQ